jgi:tetrapyrrole methylase family protein/MazG family protein/ATP diphosphatase
VGEKVSRVGFDWPDARGSRGKVHEELAELDSAIAAADADRIEAELGDVLFALVNLARHTGVDAEGALRRTIDKFTRRFDHVEQRVCERHGGWPAGAADDPLTLEELDVYWDEAKRREAAETAPAASGKEAERVQEPQGSETPS